MSQSIQTRIEAAFHARRLDEALALVSEHEADIGNALSLSLRARHAEMSGRVNEAFFLARQAVEAEPGHVGFLHQLALLANRLGYAGEALQAAGQVLAIDSSERTLKLLAFLHRGNENWQEVANVEQRLVERQPNDSRSRFNLAQALYFSGRQGESLVLCREGMGDPEQGAYFLDLMCQMKSAETGLDLIAELEKKQRQPGLGASAHITLALALANLYLDDGRTDQGFDLLDRVNAIIRKKRPAYDPAWELSYFERLRHEYPVPENAGRESGDHGFTPLFIVGLFRSGTTLTQQVLAAHSQADHVGESHAFGQAVLREYGLGATRGLYTLSSLPLLEAAVPRLQQIGLHYREIIRQRRKQDAFVIDKQPQNFAHVGFILDALPDARIIHVQRHPLDTSLSLYRTAFSTQGHYACSLDEIGRYLIGERRLMDFWRQRYPHRILTLRYEDLVLDNEATVRRLLEFCGMPFEAACLTHHQHATPVSTASAGQVDRPLFTSSIGRWQEYEDRLSALKTLYEQAGLMQ